jgi:hypothetical protein
VVKLQSAAAAVPEANSRKLGGTYVRTPIIVLLQPVFLHLVVCSVSFLFVRSHDVAGATRRQRDLSLQ